MLLKEQLFPLSPFIQELATKQLHFSLYLDHVKHGAGFVIGGGLMVGGAREDLVSLQGLEGAGESA